MSKELYLSIIIPMFNEEKRIHKAISAVKKYFGNRDMPFEVIFVDDGSYDNTIDTVNKLAKGLNYRLISYQPNKGKGYALKRGFREAEGKYILFMDADLSTPIEEFEKFTPFTGNEKRIIIGSRKSKGAKVIKPQHRIRQKLGEGFTFLSNLITNTEVSDFTCGFKLFPRRAGKKIFDKQRIKRWGYDTEILFLAKKYGYEIKEVPISWINDEDTKVNLIKDVSRSLADLAKIRYYDLKGFYD